MRFVSAIASVGLMASAQQPALAKEPDVRVTAGEVQVAQNVVMIQATTENKFEGPTNCNRPEERGILKGRVDFDTPFLLTPAVTVGLTRLDAGGGAPVSLSPLSIQGTVIALDVLAKDKSGFDYKLVTFCHTKVHSVAFYWMAIGK